jgi:MFS transporter, ACS family, glucarate transporter
VRWRVLWLMVIGTLDGGVRAAPQRVDCRRGHDPRPGADAGAVRLILSAFAWGYGIFQVPGGLFGEWLGPRRALTLAITAWGLVTLGTALLPPAAAGASLIVGSGDRAALPDGCGAGADLPGDVGCSVRAWFPLSGWAMPNAWLVVGATVGGVIAGPFVAWLVIQLGWRGSFLVASPLAFVGAALWWWYTRDDPATHPHVNEAELALIRADPPPVLDEPGAWKAVLVQRDVLLLTASYFCTGYVFYLFFNWFFFYLTEVRQFSAQVSGWFTGLQWGIGALAALAGGMICERLIRRWGVLAGTRVTAVGGLACCAGLLVAGAAASHGVLAVLLLCLSFGCVHARGYGVLGRGDGGGRSARRGRDRADEHRRQRRRRTRRRVVPLIAGLFGWFAAVASGAVFALVAAASGSPSGCRRRSVQRKLPPPG